MYIGSNRPPFLNRLTAKTPKPLQPQRIKGAVYIPPLRFTKTGSNRMHSFKQQSNQEMR